jgi:cytochrome P450
MQDFAGRFPFLIIADLMGILLEDSERLRVCSEIHGQLVTLRWDLLLAAVQALKPMLEYFSRLASERRANPGTDLMSALAAMQNRSDAPCSEAVLANCAFLLTAGHLNTINLIGNGTLALLRHPHQLRLLREQPTLLPSAVEELLRYDSPAQIIMRVAQEDAVIGGKRIAKGQRVFLLLGAANHDPERFAEPDRLDLARQDNRHLAFAPGTHYCLGAALGRLEGQVAIATLVQRFPRLRLVDAPLEWHRNLVIRGLKALPVLF